MLLNYLDSAVGFVVVILMFSLVITILVQMVGLLLQLRGKNLLRGVELLLREVDPDLKNQAQALAAQVLNHPAIADGKKRLGIALRKNEVKLILASLAEENPGLKTALTERGAAISARIDAWYEPVMDRVTERYKMNTRWVATVFAVLLAFGLQLDSINLWKQISTNSEIRAHLLAASDSLSATSQKVLDAPATTDPEQRLKALGDQAIALTSDLEETKLQLVPKPWRLTAFESTRSLLGLILSMFLLGLGAPFWYGALRNLIGLRHVVEQKDDEKEQAEREALAAKKAGQAG
jgi:hypothetical protein